jgi:phage terminase small subunit
MKTPKPPNELSPEAGRLWRAILGDYTLDEAALMVLTATLQARDRAEQARQTLAAEGAIQADRFGQKKPHPALAIERDSTLAMMRGFRLLGFDQEPRAGKG